MRNKKPGFFKYIYSRFAVSKRQQFVAITLLLTIGMVSTQWFSGTLKFEYGFILGVIAYILSALTLRYDLKGWEYLTLLTLPFYFTLAVFLFYFLLPIRWLTRLPTAILYALGMYAILLTENIFNVAAERNIQLLRAAHSVGFLLTLVTNFFLIDTILSLHLPFYFNFIFICLVVFPLTLQALWSMELVDRISSSVWIYSLIITLIIGQLAVVLSFWPIRITIESLFLTTVLYTLIGLSQQQLIGRLFSKTIREFTYILLIVVIIVLISTKWGIGGI